VHGLPCIARYGQKPGAEFRAGNLTLAVLQNEAFGATFSANSMPIALPSPTSQLRASASERPE
jgi:hypothetical protein